MTALPVILAPWRQRQEVSEFSGSFSYRQGHRGSSLKCQCGVLSTSSLSSSRLLVEIETKTSLDTSASPNDCSLKSLHEGYSLVFTEKCAFSQGSGTVPEKGEPEVPEYQIKAVSCEPTAAEAACMRCSSQNSSVDGLRSPHAN